MKQNERPRVVIVGGGFGGLTAAKKLRGAPVDVLLIDRHNYHTFLPLLYQVAAAELEAARIGYPLRTFLRRLSNARYLMAEVSSVDLVRQGVQTNEKTIPYDYLILATGSVSRFFGIPGAAEHAFSLKTMEQGVDLRNHILSRLEEATRLPDAARRRPLLTFIVVGGGSTGVEYAGALAELIHGPLAKDFPELDLDEVRVILLEAAGGLLLALPEALGRYGLKRLQRMKVEVRLEAAVTEVTPYCVYLSDGSAVEAATVVWTAGVGGEPVARRSGLPILPNDTVPVLPTMQLPGYDNVYVVGDLAAFQQEDGGYMPMLAPVAIQQGETAAGNIRRQLAGETLRPFRYRDRGSMATIGRNAAVAYIAGRSFSGFFAWILWLVVHLAYLIGYRNRVLVLINWAWNYIFFDRAIRLILPRAVKETRK